MLRGIQNGCILPSYEAFLLPIKPPKKVDHIDNNLCYPFLIKYQTNICTDHFLRGKKYQQGGGGN